MAVGLDALDLVSVGTQWEQVLVNDSQAPHTTHNIRQTITDVVAPPYAGGFERNKSGRRRTHNNTARPPERDFPEMGA